MDKMTIRKTVMEDLPVVMAIYAEAREYMRTSGNPHQWKNSHPPQSNVEGDIRRGVSHVCVDGGAVVGVFYFNVENDVTYDKIDGAWLNDGPYGVVHRIARSTAARGVGAFCLDWCFEQHPNIRIDTHRDNATMIKLLERLS